VRLRFLFGRELGFDGGEGCAHATSIDESGRAKLPVVPRTRVIMPMRVTMAPVVLLRHRV
jgi:hypothetical protein